MFPTFQMVLNKMNIEHILYIRDGSDWSYKSSVNAKVPADSVIATWSIVFQQLLTLLSAGRMLGWVKNNPWLLDQVIVLAARGQ